MARGKRHSKHSRRAKGFSKGNRRNKSRHRRPKRHSTRKQGINLSKLKLWQKIIFSLIIAVTISILAIYYEFSFLGWINFFAWLIFAFYLYKRAFIFVNSLDLSNDLYLWLTRILGVIISAIGLYFGLSMLIMSSMFNVRNAFVIGVSIVILGFGILGIFMIFRSKRRYRHFYVNR